MPLLNVGSEPYIPYMGSRVPTNTGGVMSSAPADGVPEFPLSGSVVYRFLRRAAASEVGYCVWTMNGLSALSGSSSVDHLIYMVTTIYWPPTPTNTYADATARESDTTVPDGAIALQTDNSTYWRRVSGRPRSDATNILYWVPLLEHPTSVLGTETILSETYNIYEITRPASELVAAWRKVMQSPSAQLIPGLYEICINYNSRHYLNGSWSFDAIFWLTPYEDDFWNAPPERMELFMRTAGEKAIFEDEYVTIDQIEAGSGIRLKYRQSDGSLSGYDTDEQKAYNIVIEAEEPPPTGVSVERESPLLDAVTYGPVSGKTTLGFHDAAWPRLNAVGDWAGTQDDYYAGDEILDPFMGRGALPVKWAISSFSSESVYLHAHVPHNDVWVTRRQLPPNHMVPIYHINGGTQTLSVLEFADNDVLTWEIDDIVIKNKAGHWKRGVRVRANVNPGTLQDVYIYESNQATEKNSWIGKTALDFADSTHTPGSGITEQADDVSLAVPHIGPRHLPVRWLKNTDYSALNPRLSAYIPGNGIYVEDGYWGDNGHSDDMRYNGPDGPGVQVLKISIPEPEDDGYFPEAPYLKGRHFRDSKGRDVLELGIEMLPEEAGKDLTINLAWFRDIVAGDKPRLEMNDVSRKIHLFGPYGPYMSDTSGAERKTIYVGNDLGFSIEETIASNSHPRYPGALFDLTDAPSGGGLLVEYDGEYEVDVTVQGYRYHTAQCASLVQAAAARHSLVLIRAKHDSPTIGRPRALLDRYTDEWPFGATANPTHPSSPFYWPMTVTDSAPWSMQGSSRVRLQAGDCIYFGHQIRMVGWINRWAWQMNYLGCVVRRVGPYIKDVGYSTESLGFEDWHKMGLL